MSSARARIDANEKTGEDEITPLRTNHNTLWIWNKANFKSAIS